MKPLLCELSVHLTSEWRGRLLRTCVTLIDRLNPGGLDILLIDNASPIDPVPWMPGAWDDMGVCLATDGPIPVKPPGRTIMHFPDAIGHFHHNQGQDPPPKDGPGRSNMTSLQIAYASGYERSVYQETDCLFVRPYEEGFSQLTKKVGCQDRTIQNYCDWNIRYHADLPWLRDFQFVEKYDWQNQKPDWMGAPVGEFVYEHILGDNLQILPMRGCRAGMAGVTTANLRERFSDGIEWITHADQPCFEEFLAYTGFSDMIPVLRGEA